MTVSRKFHQKVRQVSVSDDALEVSAGVGANTVGQCDLGHGARSPRPRSREASLSPRATGRQAAGGEGEGEGSVKIKLKIKSKIQTTVENSVLNLRYNHDENQIEIEKFRYVAAFFVFSRKSEEIS